MTTYAELYDRLTAVGLRVGIAESGGQHAITINDPASERSIRLAVHDGFDRTATILALSIRVREGLSSPGRMPDLRAADRVCCGRWPEFLAAGPL